MTSARSTLLMVVALSTFVIASCGKPLPPPKPIPRGGETVAPTPPPRQPKAQPPAKPKIPAHLRCQSDADCEITTFAGCCSCCSCPKPYAINKLVSQARRNRCNAVRCVPCTRACAACSQIQAGAPGRAACQDNRCVRVDDQGGKRPMGAFEGYE